MASRRRAQARQPRARAAVVPLPRVRPSRLLRFAPSPRSLLIGLGLVAFAVAAYVLLRETSAFAIRRIEVTGAPGGVRAQVRQALSPLVGHNLLALDGPALLRRVDALPTVASATYDRAFPHTLRIRIIPERPVAVLHQGRKTWLISGRGRVIGPVAPGTHAVLARVWVPTSGRVTAGQIVPFPDALTAATSLALAAHFPARISLAMVERGALTFRLRSGLELRLGDPTDVRLKLAIARRALGRLPVGTAYLDVALPERPVAGQANPQVSSGG